MVAHLTDDYSAEKSRPVPAGSRAGPWHLAAVWMTLVAGVPALVAGISYYQSGYSLARALAAVGAGGLCYLAYAIPAAFLGARTGRPTALLTRHVFGTAASVVISDLLIAAGAARLAFVSTVVAGLYATLFGWHGVAVIAAVLAVAAAAVNLFGFAGLAAVARYVTAPLLVVWAAYLVVRGVLTAHIALGGTGGSQTLPFGAGVGLAISAIAWGSEPDIWRYWKPARPRWPAAACLAAPVAGSLLLAAAGWLTASLSRGGTAEALAHGVRFSTFGVLALAAVVITVLQLGNSAGACYQITNAFQNLVGQVRGWRRWHTAVLVAAAGGLAAWAVHGSVTGFARVASWSAVVLPAMTAVMCLEVLGRRWRQTGKDRSRRIKILPLGKGGRKPNWPAIVAVLAAAGYGGWGLGLLPGQPAAPAAGFVPAQAWLLAVVLYGAAVTARNTYSAARSALRRVRGAAASRAEARQQAAAARAEARQQALAARAEARQQAMSDRATAKQQAASSRAEAKKQAIAERAEARAEAAAGARKARRARGRRRPAAPAAAPQPPPQPRPRDYLDTIRRDLRAEAPANLYVELVRATAVPRGRLRDLAGEQARARVSDQRSFLYLAARSSGPAGALFTELADAERRAQELLAGFAEAVGPADKPGAGPQRPGCSAYSAFVAWLALNAQPVDAALAVVACRPAWSTSFAGIGRALRENPGYRLGDSACAFFDLMAGLDASTDEQLLAVLSASLDGGQLPQQAAGYAKILGAYQTMFWAALATEATEPVAAADRQ